MSKMKTSWLLMKQSFEVLKKNKKLLLFPLISCIPLLFIVMFCFFGFISDLFDNMMLPNTIGKSNETSLLDNYKNQGVEEKKISSSEVKNDNNKIDQNWISSNIDKNDDKKINKNSIPFIYYIIIYFVSMLYVTYFNTAFFNEIIHALNGQEVSIVGSIKFANSKWKSILFWAILASTIGVIITRIEEKFGFIGKLILGIIGITWSMATVFAIPVIIRENNSANPIKVLKDSGNLIKKKWGEGLIGYAGLGLFGLSFVFMFTIACMIVAGIFFLIQEDCKISIVSIGLFWVIIVFCFFYLQRIIGNIFKCALYLYVSEGVMPLGLDEETINTVWKVQKKKD